MAVNDDLKNLMTQDLQQLRELTDVLEQEKACLSASDVRALQDLTSEKNRILSDVRERAKQKIHCLVAMGYKPDHGEPSRFIQSAGMSDLFDLWKQADAAMRHCQGLNEHNGRVVGHLQKRLGRLTDIFRGATGQQKLYGQKGQHTSVSSRTMLASA